MASGFWTMAFEGYFRWGTQGQQAHPNSLLVFWGDIYGRMWINEVVPMQNQNVYSWTQIKKETKNRFWPNVNIKGEVKLTISENHTK